MCVFSLGALILAIQATQHYRDNEREDPNANTNVPDRGRAAVLVPVPTEPCTDDLNAVGIKDRCERANEARMERVVNHYSQQRSRWPPAHPRPHSHPR